MGTLLEGRAAVITGGGGGIGREIALAMAAEGAALVINDLKRADGTSAADAVVEEVTAAGGRAVANYSNITDADEADALIQASVDSFGSVDALVNCAGNTVRARILELTEEQWDSVISVHMKGHFLCSQAAVRRMLEQGHGRIVTVASRGAFHTSIKADPGGISSVAYAAAKAGIMGFTSTLSLELAGTGVTVNCLLPSATTQLFPGTTPRTMGGMPPAISLDPDYVAPLVVFLSSDASAGINGRYVYAAGGDICFYHQPIQVEGSHVILRKNGKWTPEELGELLPPMYSVAGV